MLLCRIPLQVCFEVSAHTGRVHFHLATDGSRPLGLSLPLELLLMEGRPASLESLLTAIDSRLTLCSAYLPPSTLFLTVSGIYLRFSTPLGPVADAVEGGINAANARGVLPGSGLCGLLYLQPVIFPNHFVHLAILQRSLRRTSPIGTFQVLIWPHRKKGWSQQATQLYRSESACHDPWLARQIAAVDDSWHATTDCHPLASRC